PQGRRFAGGLPPASFSPSAGEWGGVLRLHVVWAEFPRPPASVSRAGVSLGDRPCGLRKGTARVPGGHRARTGGNSDDGESHPATAGSGGGVMADKVYLKCSAKEKTFSNGGSIIKLGIKVADLIAFAQQHGNERGYLN